MKKIISLCLTFAMVFSLCSTAFAQSFTIDCELSSINSETVAYLNMHHIAKEKLVSIESKVDSPPTYIYQLTDTVRSEITVEKKSNGRLLGIKEGTLVNTLEITNDGRYILNGNIVTFSGSDIIPSFDADTIMPRYPVDTYYTETCPYGSASDYTKYVRSAAEANISFGTSFANISLTAFTLVVGALVNPVIGLSASFAAAILTSFQEYDPHSSYASYKETQYVHNTKGSFVTVEKSVIMYSMDLWPEADYKGTVVHRNAYHVTLWENGEG